ncbi:hypothetical protein [Leptothoe kymatousa]|uniref:Uncharacterized protein n=1 Tax=Leptothoe kymatousa TAU-MAC 1615 TaxID=2364775 RepID=A0ABS5Y7E2_9CYAN|nr:hypothetical protein [Leptothoe kymatousa]MBT9313748.1 hypothetical protein [Leptothoe kymatousa TAU-MAC 1615]
MLNPTPKTQSLESLMSNILRCRRITRANQRMLMASLLNKAQLNSDEQAQVNKIFEAITHGRLRVVD